MTSALILIASLILLTVATAMAVPYIRRTIAKRTLKAVAVEARHWADLNHTNAHHYSTLLGSLRYIAAKDDPFDRELNDRIAAVSDVLATVQERADRFEAEALAAEARYAAFAI